MNYTYINPYLKGGDFMDLDVLYGLYKSVKITGLLNEEQLLKEINSPGVSPEIRDDLKYRLWTLRANNFKLA